MTPSSNPPADAEAIVTAEFQTMLARCEAAGVAREDAAGILSFKLLFDSVQRSGEERRAREAAAAQTPAGQALQKAWELYQQSPRLSHGYHIPDTLAFKQACEEYLLLAHGAIIGDSLEIHGWAKPRTLRLTAFQLSFDGAAQATDAFMWFEGDPVRNCPKNRSPNSHGCPLKTPVYRV